MTKLSLCYFRLSTRLSGCTRSNCRIADPREGELCAYGPRGGIKKQPNPTPTYCRASPFPGREGRQG